MEITPAPKICIRKFIHKEENEPLRFDINGDQWAANKGSVQETAPNPEWVSVPKGEVIGIKWNGITGEVQDIVA